MTPADIAKVREALDPERGCSTCRGSGIRPGATKLFPSPGEPSPTCLDCGGNGRCSRVRKALSILDAEAKRKTSTHFRLERKDTIGWYAHGGFFVTRERAEEVGRGMRMDFRILEVTESWEEPTT